MWFLLVLTVITTHVLDSFLGSFGSYYHNQGTFPYLYFQTYREYCTSYQRVKYDAVKNAFGYFNAHNNYCLQIKASNSLIKNYKTVQLPSILKVSST